MKGLAVEQEHAATAGGDQVNIAAIVLDHLREDPDYYSKIESIGLDSSFVESEHPRDEDGKFTGEAYAKRDYSRNKEFCSGASSFASQYQKGPKDT